MKNMKNRKLIIFLLVISHLLMFVFGVGFYRRTFSTLATNTNQSIEFMEKVSSLESFLERNYLRDVDSDQLRVGQLKGMVASLEDPYSEYLTAEEFDDLMEHTSGKFYGIGVYITSKDGYLTVISPIKDTPAEEAGLQSEDKIIAVDGVDISGYNPDQATKLIKGEKGTTVTLSIIRGEGGDAQYFDVDVKRDEIHVTTVEHSDLDDVLYVSISQFTEETHNEFVQAIENIKPSHKGMVLDLRSNPGGMLSTCVKVADEMLEQGVVVYTENRDGEVVDILRSHEGSIDIPIVVLVNKGSASASEIVAGALRDHNRGIILGETTFGKGVVQSIERFADGDGIKLTVSEYFTPSGESIDQKGIEPDIEVELPKDVKGIGVENLEEDTQLQRALEELRK